MCGRVRECVWESERVCVGESVWGRVSVGE